MHAILTRSTALALALGLVAVPVTLAPTALAEEPKAADAPDTPMTDTPQTAALPAADQPAGTLLSSDLRRAPVQNQQGEAIADLQGLVFDESGRISHAVLAFGGFLGFGSKEVMIPWERFDVVRDKDVRVLSLAITEQELEAMPAFRSTTARERAEEVARQERELRLRQQEGAPVTGQ